MMAAGQDFIDSCQELRQVITGRKVQKPVPMMPLDLPELPESWTWTSLSSLCERVSVGHVGPTSEYFCEPPDGIPFIRSQDVRPGKLTLANVAHVVESFHQKLKKSQLKSGDILIVRVGANRGDCCVVPDGVGSLNCANIVFARPLMPNQFLGFYFNTDFGQSLLSSLTTGSAQGVLNTQSIATIPVPVPPLPTQRKIASILSAYDDLIENNSRRIAILEEMAQAIYREWFVNFRFPGHENVKLVQSTLGMIPKGWECATLESVLSFYIGGGWGKEVEEKGFTKRGAVIRGTDIPDAKHLNVTTCPTRFHTDSNIRSRRLQNQDIVFEVSGGSKGQPVGRSLFVSDRLLACFDSDVICASFCKLIRPNDARLCSSLVYHYLLECYTNGVIEQYEVQSTGIKNFKFTEFIARERIIVPLTELQQQFQTHFQAIQSEIEILGKKISNLRTTRDLLLPKLISGQLDVENLDIDVGMIAELLEEDGMSTDSQIRKTKST